MGVNSRYKGTCTSNAALVNKYIGTAYDHVKNVSDNMDDVKTVSDALGEDFPGDGLDTLVENIDDVVTVATDISGVTTVAGIKDEVVTVAGIEQEIIDVPSYTAQAIDAANAAEQDADRATEQADLAANIADPYKGLWPDVGGSANKGDIYQTQAGGTETGQYFTALQGTMIDPIGDDVNWREVVSAEYLGGIEVTSTGSTVPRRLDDRFAELGNVKDDGVTGDGSESSLGINSSLSKNNTIKIGEGSYLVSTPLDTPVSSKIQGDGNTKTIVNLTDSFIDNDGTSNSDTSVERIGLVGSGKTDGVTAIKRDGTVNSARETFKSISIDDCEVGIQNSAGWNQLFDQLFIRGCGTGFLGVESPILSGWGSSGYVMMNSYFGNNDTGIDDTTQFNATYINPIIENNGIGYKQNGQGSTTVMINPWFEDNVLPPEWRRGSVVLGGRGVDFSDTVLSAFDSDKCLMHIFDGGIKLFRDISNPILNVTGDGVKGFISNFNELGWQYTNVNTDLAPANMFQVQQEQFFGNATRKATTGEETLVTFGAKMHDNANNFLTMPAVGLKVTGNSSSANTGFIRTYLQSGRWKAEGDAFNNIGDRWLVDYLGEFIPVIDATYDIGKSDNRVNDMFIVNAPTTGSDARIKTDEKPMSQELLDFALSVELKHWKFNDGERYHSGIVITEDFLANLDKVMKIDDCAAICHTVFEDEHGNAITKKLHDVELGDLWQVRQDEWQNILLEAMRRKILKM